MKRRLLAVLAALGAVLAFLYRGPTRWQGRARSVQQRGTQEATEAVRRIAQEREIAADAKLNEDRGMDRASALAAALERARRRRSAGDH